MTSRRPGTEDSYEGLGVEAQVESHDWRAKWYGEGLAVVRWSLDGG